MDFDFSEDQKLLADQVQRYLREQCGADVVRRVLDGEIDHAASVWQGLSEMGLLGTAIPEQYGGTGAGYLELCLVAQQVGAHMAPVPFSSTVYLAAEALLAYGSEVQKTQWLPKICDGSIKAAFATSEGLGQLGNTQLQTQFTDGVVNGHKNIVTDAGLADLYVVYAEHDSGPCLCLVEASERVKITQVDSVDLTKNTAALDFDQAPGDMLAADGKQALNAIYDRAAVLFAFEQLGGAQSALDMAVSYAQERYAFGRAIGSFQAIKHMLADMFVAMKLAESNCFYAAWALQNNSEDLPLAAATARVAATQAYQLCAKDNIQVHGGMGFTWEFDCHLYYRRSNYLALELGSLSEWEAKLVKSLPLQGTT